jgi:hypothetical protein
MPFVERAKTTNAAERPPARRELDPAARSLEFLPWSVLQMSRRWGYERRVPYFHRDRVLTLVAGSHVDDADPTTSLSPVVDYFLDLGGATYTNIEPEIRDATGSVTLPGNDVVEGDHASRGHEIGVLREIRADTFGGVVAVDHQEVEPPPREELLDASPRRLRVRVRPQEFPPAVIPGRKSERATLVSFRNLLRKARPEDRCSRGWRL